MNNKLLGALSAACISLLLSACGSDNSASAEDEYSSSVIANEVKQSSSSEIASSSSSPRNDNSSSSVIANEVTQSSSSTAAPCNVDGENNCNYGTLTDSRDGHTYKTVTIGTQTWMADNLNYETENSYCYNDDPSNCSKYGLLYTWAAAKTVCPSGWHLPSTTEWKTLFTAVGGSSTAGTALKSTGGWYNDGNGTDAFGFSALPAGYRYSNGYYDDEGDDALFWSSTESTSGYAYDMYLYYYSDGASLYYDDKYYGFSVRCLKD